MGSIDPWWPSGCLASGSDANSWYFRVAKFFNVFGPILVTFPSVKTQSWWPNIFFAKIAPKSVGIGFFSSILVRNSILSTFGHLKSFEMGHWHAMTKCPGKRDRVFQEAFPCMINFLFERSFRIFKGSSASSSSIINHPRSWNSQIFSSTTNEIYKLSALLLCKVQSTVLWIKPFRIYCAKN